MFRDELGSTSSNDGVELWLNLAAAARSLSATSLRLSALNPLGTRDPALVDFEDSLSPTEEPVLPIDRLNAKPGASSGDAAPTGSARLALLATAASDAASGRSIPDSLALRSAGSSPRSLLLRHGSVTNLAAFLSHARTGCAADRRPEPALDVLTTLEHLRARASGSSGSVLSAYGSHVAALSAASSNGARWSSGGDLRRVQSTPFLRRAGTFSAPAALVLALDSARAQQGRHDEHPRMRDLRRLLLPESNSLLSIAATQSATAPHLRQASSM